MRAHPACRLSGAGALLLGVRVSLGHALWPRPVAASSRPAVTALGYFQSLQARTLRFAGKIACQAASATGQRWPPPCVLPHKR